MIRFRSTLPPDVLARHLAPVAWPPEWGPDREPPYADDLHWQITPAHGLYGVDDYHISWSHRDPGCRARFLAVLAELGAEVVDG